MRKEVTGRLIRPGGVTWAPQLSPNRDQRGGQMLEQAANVSLRDGTGGDERPVEGGEREPRQMIGLLAVGVKPKTIRICVAQPHERQLAHAIDDSVDLTFSPR